MHRSQPGPQQQGEDDARPWGPSRPRGPAAPSPGTSPKTPLAKQPGNRSETASLGLSPGQLTAQVTLCRSAHSADSKDEAQAEGNGLTATHPLARLPVALPQSSTRPGREGPWPTSHLSAPSSGVHNCQGKSLLGPGGLTMYCSLLQSSCFLLRQTLHRLFSMEHSSLPTHLPSTELEVRAVKSSEA